MAFISGPFDLFLCDYADGSDPVSLGITEAGFEIEEVELGEKIVGDNLGKTAQDYVQQGRDCYLNMILSEPDLLTVRKLNNMTSSGTGVPGLVPKPGVLGSAEASWIQAVACAGTPAADATYDTYDFPRCILPPNYPRTQLFASAQRKLPLRLIVLPYVDSGTVKHFLPTATVS